MSLSVQMSNTFNASNIVFSNLHKNKFGGKAIYLNNGSKNKKVYLQLPYMRAPFGLSSFTDEATKKTSYSLQLSFDDTPELNELKAQFQAFDDLVIDTVAKNSAEWLGKKYNINVIREALYKPVVQPGKGDYPATMKLKVMTDIKTGSFLPEAYNAARKPVTFDTVTGGQKVMSIIEISSIWFIDNKFGVSVKVQQVLMDAPTKLPSFAFQGVGTAAIADGDDEAATDLVEDEDEDEEFDE